MLQYISRTVLVHTFLDCVYITVLNFLRTSTCVCTCSPSKENGYEQYLTVQYWKCTVCTYCPVESMGDFLLFIQLPRFRHPTSY
jgi:hypothetical protein